MADPSEPEAIEIGAEWTDEAIAAIVPTLQRLQWAGTRTRAKIQSHGVDVIPSNYYSAVPSIEEIETSFEYREKGAPYLDSGIFDPDALTGTLERLLPFSAEFDPPREGNEEDPAGFFWENSQFSFSDAMAYYCLARMARPPTIVEIGGGFSTLVARRALEKNGSGSLHCIEPYPREFLRGDRRIALHPVKAQEISAEQLNGLLEDGSILFIDSTHTVKTGSDCLHIYLRLLPKMRSNILVHVHDVFLPFGMPKEWLTKHRLSWTEQYLLLAFLLNSPRTSVLYGSADNDRWNAGLMEKLMGGKWRSGGSSFWFRYRAS